MYRDSFVEIGVENGTKKPWVYVKTLKADHRHFVSFRQLFEEIRLIIQCERDKYKDAHLPENRDPSWLVRRFLAYAGSDAITWEQTAKELQLERDQ